MSPDLLSEPELFLFLETQRFQHSSLTEEAHPGYELTQLYLLLSCCFQYNHIALGSNPTATRHLYLKEGLTPYIWKSISKIANVDVKKCYVTLSSLWSCYSPFCKPSIFC